MFIIANGEWFAQKLQPCDLHQTNTQFSMKLTLAISGLTASLTLCLLVSSPQLKLTQKIFLGIVGILGAERCIVTIYRFPRKEISKVEQKLAEAEKSRLECENRKLVILQQSRKLAVQLSEAETDPATVLSGEILSLEEEYLQKLNLSTQENIRLQQHLETLSLENQRLYERVQQLTRKLEREHQLLQEQQYQIEFNQSYQISSDRLDSMLHYREIELQETISLLEAQKQDLTYKVNTLIQEQQQYRQQIASLEQVNSPLDASWESVIARQIQTYYKENQIQLNYIDTYQNNNYLIFKFQIRPPAQIHQALDLLDKVRTNLSLETLDIEFKSSYLKFKLQPNDSSKKPQAQLTSSSFDFKTYSGMTSTSEDLQSLKSASATSQARVKLKNVATSTQKKSCPHCGSQALRKNGKSRSGIQRYRCKDCQKTFSLDSENSMINPPDSELN